MYSNIHATSVLSQSKAKKFKVLPGHYTHYLAFLRIDLEFQFVLQVFPAGFQETHCCPFAFG